LKNLPYRIRIDSDDLYLPSKEKRRIFISWLIGQVKNIHIGIKSRDWENNRLGLHTFYEFVDNNRDKLGKLQIGLSKLQKEANLSIDFHSYGGLNIESINRNVQKGIKQLNASAHREDNKKIPRIIVLRLSSGIDFLHLELENEIKTILNEHDSLSAIVVFTWASKVSSGSIVSLKSLIRYIKSPRQVAFHVYHNSQLGEASRLSHFVFDDGLSEQTSIR
jgi:hypothetical protein